MSGSGSIRNRETSTVSRLTHFCIICLLKIVTWKKAARQLRHWTYREIGFYRWQWLRQVGGNHDESPTDSHDFSPAPRPSLAWRDLRTRCIRTRSHPARVNSFTNFGRPPGWIFKILHGPRASARFFFLQMPVVRDDNHPWVILLYMGIGWIYVLTQRVRQQSSVQKSYVTLHLIIHVKRNFTHIH